MPGEDESIIGDLLTRGGLQQIVDSINKLEGTIKTISAYLFSNSETPAGTINGTNKVFTVANAPDPVLSLKVFLNGTYRAAGGADYTLDNITITFLKAPLSNSVLRVYYRYK